MSKPWRLGGEGIIHMHVSAKITENLTMKNLPGPGDNETWPAAGGHPNDPRTPEEEEPPEDEVTAEALSEVELRAYESGHEKGYELGYDDGWRDAQEKGCSVSD